MSGLKVREKEKADRTLYSLVMGTIVTAIIALSSIILILTTALIIPMFYKISFISIFLLKDITDSFFVAGFATSVVLLSISIVYLERNVRLLSVKLSNLSSASSRPDDTKAISNEELLKYLDEGERRLYGLLVDSNGSLLQKNLVGLDGMSRATVSRLVDRLEKKGIVEKIRHGSTNMIVLKRTSR